RIVNHTRIKNDLRGIAKEGCKTDVFNERWRSGLIVHPDMTIRYLNKMRFADSTVGIGRPQSIDVTSGVEVFKHPRGRPGWHCATAWPHHMIGARATTAASIGLFSIFIIDGPFVLIWFS